MKKIYFITVFISLGLILLGFDKVHAQCISNVIITTEDVSCNGGNDGAITVEVENGTGPFYYELVLVTGTNGEFPLIGLENVNSNVVTFSLEEGTAHPTFGIFSDSRYRLRVTSSDSQFPPGCNLVQINNITVGQPDILEANFSTEPDCDATGIGSIDLTVTGGTAPYTFTWSNGLPSQEDHLGTLSAGTYAVDIEDARGCTVSLANIEVTEFTIADAGADQTICLDNATLSGNTLKANETGTWSSTNPAIVFADVNSPTTTVSGLAVGANTLTWTVSDNNGVCADNSDEVIITVDEITVADAGADQDICIDNTTLTANEPAVGETGLWTVTTGTGTFVDASVYNTTVSGLSEGINEFTWTITDASGVCPPTSDVVAINFTDLTIADAGADQTICLDNATLSGNILKEGETGTWSSTNPTIVFADVNSPTTTVSGLAVGANTLTWTVSDNNGVCADNFDDVIITVDEITVANAGADQDICIDNTTLAGNEPAAGETGLWTVTSGTGSFADATLYNTTVSGLSEGINEFTWTITDASGVCPPTSDVVAINFTDLTIADAGEDQTICLDNATLSGNTLKTGETGTWSSTNPAVVFADVNSPTTTVSGLAVGANTLTWTVSDNNGVCADNSDEVIITVDEITVADAGADQDICIDNTTLTANEPAVGETGLWTATTGTGTFVDASVYNTSVSGLSEGVNEFTWTITDDSGVCPPTSDVVAINFTDLTIADAGDGQTICLDNATLSGNTLKAGETGTWSSTDPAVVFADVNSPTTTVSGLAIGANTLTWTVTDNNGVCTSNSDEVIITVDEITKADAGADQDICIDNTTLAGNEPAAGETGLWTVTSGTGTFADATLYNTTVSGLSEGVNEFTWTITDASGVCPPTSDVVAINFTDLTIADAGDDQTICLDNATLAGNTLKAGETGTWSSTNPAIIFADVNSPTTTLSGLAVGANTLTWTVTDNNGVCTSNSDEVIITVDEITVANAGADQDICIDNTTLAGNDPAAGETGLWTVTSGTGTLADPTLYNTTVSGLSEGVNEFTWTITDASGVCPPTSDIVAINFTDLTIADAGDDQTICLDNATLAGNTLKAGETGTWSSTNPAIVFADVNSPTTTVSGLTLGANTLTWTVRDNNGVCADNSDEVIITVDEITVANAGPDQDICIDNTTLAGNDPATGESGLWTVTSGTGTFSDATLYNATVSGLSEGVNEFTWTITDASGVCPPTSDVVAINFTDLTIADAGEDQTICLDNATLSGNTLKAGETGIWSSTNPAVVFADVNSPTTTVSGLVIGANTLTWTVTDNNGVCTSNSDEVIITVDEITVANAGADQNVCDPMTTLSATPVTAPEAGTWTIAAGSGVFTDINDPATSVSGLSVGVNQFVWTVNNPSGACPSTADTVNIEYRQISASATTTAAACTGVANGSIAVTASGGTAPYQYSLDGFSFQNSNVFNGLSTGSYSVTARDANGCERNFLVMIGQDPILTASVTTTASATEICAGDEVTFTATPTNGGSAPTYQWFINGTAEAGATGSTFTSSALNHGDAVTVEMTAAGTGLTCITGSPATSTPITISVPGALVAEVTVTASAAEICAGDAVTFTATPINGGSAPTYQWFINGAPEAGATASAFTSSTLSHGDVVTVEMTAGGTAVDCITGSPNTSAPVTISVPGALVAEVAVTASAAEICAGDAVIFTAAPTNGGDAPTYQWFINGTPEAGATGVTFTSTTLNDGDVVTVEMTADASGSTCITGSPATSTPVTIDVPGTLLAEVTITKNVTEICPGDAVIFTAIPNHGGSSPTYQWYLNGSAPVGETGPTFTANNLKDGDEVFVEMTPGGDGIGCVTNAFAESNIETIAISSTTLSASVVIAPNNPEICAGETLSFTATPTNGGSAPTYQWFVNGAAAGITTEIFTTSSLVDGDVVTVEMTAGGNGSGCIIDSPAMSPPSTVTVPPTLVAEVTVSADATEICAGDAVTFTATPVNGGSDPTYQWMVNGTAATGATDPTFTASTLADGDIVTVEMTAGGTGIACNTGSPALSTPVSINVSAELVAEVTVVSSAAEICAGDAVIFTATPVNGGSDPTYQWFINGTPETGAIAATFASSSLNHGDEITVEMTPGGTVPPCVTGIPAQSAPFTISVPGTLVAEVSISATAEVICAGDAVIFTANPVNGGSTPTYQWYINGAPEAGANGPSFTSTTLSDLDIVTVEMTAAGSGTSCITGSPAMSNPIEISIPGALIASVTITKDLSAICPGDPVIFTATPTHGGTNPTYQWYVNGSAPVGETNPTFTANNLSDGDEIFVEMMPGGDGISCVTNTFAESNYETISISSNLVSASVSISPVAAEICAGDAVTFTATPTNGGSAPTYQWFVNGNPAGAPTDSIFTVSTLVDGDVVTVEMTAGGTGIGCIIDSPAMSAPATISVPGTLTASVSISPIDPEICAGEAVTFRATPTNGGSAPTYQWFVNGTAAGVPTDSIFTTSTLVDGDIVTVEMTAAGTGIGCIIDSPAMSNPSTVSVPGNITASVDVTPSATEICVGEAVTFTAMATHGGSAPTYQWFVNGTAAGITTETFTTSTLSDGDIVTVEMTAGGTGISCVIGSPAMSDPEVITIKETQEAAVSVEASEEEICAGAAVNFTATPMNGGDAPTFQWYINGTAVAGATASVYTSTTLNHGDNVTVEMTAGGTDIACISGSPAMSDPIEISIPGALLASVTISQDLIAICPGDPVIFTAEPEHGGTSPSYQWYVNGSAPVGETGPIFTANNLQDGDEVFVEMIPGGDGIGCVTNSFAESNIVNVAISTTPLSASVSISPIDPQICAGEAVTFRATPTNGGSAPTYQWFVNGTAAGVPTDSIFTSSTLVEGDVVTVEMTAAGTGVGCIIDSPAMSNPSTVSVPGNITALVEVTPSATEICSGEAVTFTASPKNGGSAPTYQWFVNGTAAGITTETFTTSTLNEGDIVTVEMTAGGTGISCIVGSPVMSAPAGITITETQEAAVTVEESATEICAGAAVTFTATPFNGGDAPTYQWYINKVAVPDATTSIFTSTTLNDQDTVTVEMAAGGAGIACISGSPAMSDPIEISVPGALVATVTITKDLEDICPGDAVEFTAISEHGGNNPGYQWYVNGIASAGETGTTFTANNLNNGDEVWVEMIPGGDGIGCVTNPVAESNKISIAISTTPLTASVTISPIDPEICAGEAVTFRATPTHGGSAPTYQWFVNGNPTGAPTDSIFTTSTLVEGDIVTVEMTAAGTGVGCIIDSPAMSAPSTVTVPGNVTASVEITPSATEICTGEAVTFTATPTHGGSTPTYQWFVNGAAAGITTETFTISTLNDGDVVTVEMTSGGTGISCVVGSPATSNAVAITVANSLVASVSIAHDPIAICPGDQVTFAATEIHGGSAPVYQWYLNEIAEAGETNSTYLLTNPSEGDRVRVEMLPGGSGISCVPGDVVTSNVIEILFATQTPQPVLTTTSFDYCEGDVIADLEATGTDLKWYTDEALTNLIGTGSPFATGIDGNVSASHTFYVTQTSAGCGESEAVEVTINIDDASPAPVVGSASIDVCQGAAAPTLTATGNDLKWYNDVSLTTSVGSGASYTPSAAELDMTVVGSTIFYVTQDIGCGESLATQITVNVTAQSSTPTSIVSNLCQGSPIQPLVVVGTNITWYADLALTTQIATGNTFTPSATQLDVTTPGNKIFYFTQDTGCGESLAATATVNVLDAMDPLCNGGGATSCGAFSFQFNNTAPTCGGDDGSVRFIDIFYNGATPPFSFGIRKVGDAVFDMVPNNPNFSNLSAGDYEYKVVNLNNNDFCEGTFVLRPETSVIASATNFVNSQCFGEPFGKARIDASESSTGNYYYSLDGATWQLFVPGTDISGLWPNGTYNIMVGEKPNDTCPALVEVTINNQFSDIQLTVESTDATCNVNDGSVTLNGISGGLAPYEVALEKVGTPLVYQPFDPNTPMFFDKVSQGYHNLIIRDANGCTKTRQILVNAPNLVVFDLLPDNPKCENGGMDGRFLIQIDDYLPGVAYKYAITQGDEDPETFIPITQQFQAIPNLTVGSYKVFITTDGQCINEQVEELTGGAAAVSAALEVSDIQCFGETGSVRIMNFTGSAEEKYDYVLLDKQGEVVTTGPISPNQTILGFTINNLLRGDYVLQLGQYQGSMNCTVNAPAYNFTIGGPASSVIYDEVEVEVSLPDQPTGSMRLKKVKGGKAGYFAKIIDFEPKFLDKTDYPIETFDLIPSLDGISYEVKINELYAGTYYLILTDALGCEQEIMVEVDYDRSIFIPNIFTPNGDQFNETFYIRNLPETGSTLVITNRWGKIVYENNNYTNSDGWNGGNMPDGIYYYKLMANDESFTGWVEIWRGKPKE